MHLQRHLMMKGNTMRNGGFVNKRIPIGALALASIIAASTLTDTARAAETLPSINLQLTPWTVVAREKGIFKEEFDKIGTKTINLIASGTADLIGAESA